MSENTILPRLVRLAAALTATFAEIAIFWTVLPK
jgi:hypothetical protein